MSSFNNDLLFNLAIKLKESLASSNLLVDIKNLGDSGKNQAIIAAIMNKI
jgi:hypothetical protein